jgi:hypothetical protein
MPIGAFRQSLNLANFVEVATPARFSAATRAVDLTGTSVSSTGGRFNGSVFKAGEGSDVITVNPADTNWQFSSNRAWTIEFWFNTSTASYTAPTNIFLGGFNFGDSSGILLSLPSGVANTLRITIGGSTANIALSTSYRHFAFVNNGTGTCVLYVDGVAQLTNSSYTYTPPGGQERKWYYGSTAGNAGQPTYFFDELRISNIARYTANFTAPSAAFVDDAPNLGLFHFDNNYLDDYTPPAVSLPNISNFNNMVTLRQDGVDGSVNAGGIDGFAPINSEWAVIFNRAFIGSEVIRTSFLQKTGTNSFQFHLSAVAGVAPGITNFANGFKKAIFNSANNCIDFFGISNSTLIIYRYTNINTAAKTYTVSSRYTSAQDTTYFNQGAFDVYLRPDGTYDVIGGVGSGTAQVRVTNITVSGTTSLTVTLTKTPHNTFGFFRGVSQRSDGSYAIFTFQNGAGGGYRGYTLSGGVLTQQVFQVSGSTAFPDLGTTTLRWNTSSTTASTNNLNATHLKGPVAWATWFTSTTPFYAFYYDSTNHTIGSVVIPNATMAFKDTDGSFWTVTGVNDGEKIIAHRSNQASNLLLISKTDGYLTQLSADLDGSYGIPTYGEANGWEGHVIVGGNRFTRFFY